MINAFLFRHVSWDPIHHGCGHVSRGWGQLQRTIARVFLVQNAHKSTATPPAATTSRAARSFAGHWPWCLALGVAVALVMLVASLLGAAISGVAIGLASVATVLLSLWLRKCEPSSAKQTSQPMPAEGSPATEQAAAAQGEKEVAGSRAQLIVLAYSPFMGEANKAISTLQQCYGILKTAEVAEDPLIIMDKLQKTMLHARQAMHNPDELIKCFAEVRPLLDELKTTLQCAKSLRYSEIEAFTNALREPLVAAHPTPKTMPWEGFVCGLKACLRGCRQALADTLATQSDENQYHANMHNSLAVCYQGFLQERTAAAAMTCLLMATYFECACRNPVNLNCTLEINQ